VYEKFEFISDNSDEKAKPNLLSIEKIGLAEVSLAKQRFREKTGSQFGIQPVQERPIILPKNSYIYVYIWYLIASNPRKTGCLLYTSLYRLNAKLSSGLGVRTFLWTS